MDCIWKCAFSRQQAEKTHTNGYRWRLMQRRDEFSPVLSDFQLFQHNFVDQFSKIDAERLFPVLQNQQTIRAEKYTDLLDV